MVWMEDGCYRRGKAGFRDVARVVADGSGGYGACFTEYVIFDCEVEVSLARREG